MSQLVIKYLNNMFDKVACLLVYLKVDYFIKKITLRNL